MRGAVRKASGVDIQLRPAPHTPEEMRVRGGEVIEKVFAPFQHLVGNSIVLVQELLRKAPHALVRSRHIAYPGRRVDPRQERVQAGGAPGQNRDRLQLLPGISGQKLGLWELTGGP